MRDLFWTLIIAWLVWQLVNIFRRPLVKHQKPEAERPITNPGGESASGKRRILDNAGEFVEFEEIR